MPKTKIWFVASKEPYKPMELPAEDITVGGIEFQVSDAYDHLDKKIPGRKTLSRNGIPIHDFDASVPDVQKYIKGRVRELFSGKEGVDADKFITAYIAHIKRYEKAAKLDRHYYREESHYLRSHMKVKK